MASNNYQAYKHPLSISLYRSLLTFNSNATKIPTNLNGKVYDHGRVFIRPILLVGVTLSQRYRYIHDYIPNCLEYNIRERYAVGELGLIRTQEMNLPFSIRECIFTYALTYV